MLERAGALEAVPERVAAGQCQRTVKQGAESRPLYSAVRWEREPMGGQIGERGSARR